MTDYYKKYGVTGSEQYDRTPPSYTDDLSGLREDLRDIKTLLQELHNDLMYIIAQMK